MQQRPASVVAPELFHASTQRAALMAQQGPQHRLPPPTTPMMGGGPLGADAFRAWVGEALGRPIMTATGVTEDGYATYAVCVFDKGNQAKRRYLTATIEWTTTPHPPAYVHLGELPWVSLSAVEEEEALEALPHVPPSGVQNHILPAPSESPLRVFTVTRQERDGRRLMYMGAETDRPQQRAGTPPNPLEAFPWQRVAPGVRVVLHQRNRNPNAAPEFHPEGDLARCLGTFRCTVLLHPAGGAAPSDWPPRQQRQAGASPHVDEPMHASFRDEDLVADHSIGPPQLLPRT